MDENIKRHAQLITRYMQGKLNVLERTELEAWINESEANQQFFNTLNSPYKLRNTLNKDDEKRKYILKRIHESMAKGRRKPGFLWWISWRWPMIVAIAAIIVIAGAWLIVQPAANSTRVPERYQGDALPATDKARLQLDDGAVIILLDTVNGELARDASNKAVIYKENGWLTYLQVSPGDTNYYNTLTVPRNGQYRLILPDGSRVWLNAGSTLRYPVIFGHHRRIKLEGQAYFEITHLPAQAIDTAGNRYTIDSGHQRPFIIDVTTPADTLRVQLPGGRLDICAYEDEASLQTTMVQGTAQLHRGANQLRLRQGQQGRLEADGGLSVIRVDPGETISWKEGLFRFSQVPLDKVLQQVARWYDVEVIFERKEQDYVTGSIDRNLPLTKVLLTLEQLTPARFTLQDNKVTVK